jgi:adhesin/invasin
LTTFRSILFAALCLAVLSAPFASAQTQPFSISTYQGNGQMVCSGCPFATYQNFEPMVAKVVDANGVPVAGVTVTWYPIGGNGNLQTNQTVTDNNGLTTNVYSVGITSGSSTTPFVPNQIIAAVGNSTALFYETQALALSTGTDLVQVAFVSLPASLSGAAGSTGAAIQVAAGSYNIPIAGVEVRLLNNQTNATVACATGPGADPGTVLTDTTGIAVCNPILSGSGSGQFTVLVGGVAASVATGQPIGYAMSGNISLTVSAPSPGSIAIYSGNNQSATAGSTLSSPLAAVVNATNGNPIAFQAVTWSVSPSNAGTLLNPSASSDSNGKVQTGFSISPNASGNIAITVSIPNNGNIKATFSVNAVPLVTISSLQKVNNGGDGQTAASGQTFTNPLVVQVVNSNGQLAAGVTVNFSVSGPATLSTSTPSTNSSGQAQVTVAAGTTSVQASVTVTASVAGLTQTFQLTVIPPGPVITATSFVNAADQKIGSISPCSLATVIGPGIAPNIQGTLVGAPFGPGPAALAGAAITFSGAAASPVFSISNSNNQQSMTFQVPCEITASAALPVTVSVGGGSAQVNVPVLAVSPGVFGAVGTDGVTRATLARQDGSFVSLSNPARRGETVTAFVTGLGPTSPQVSTNQLPPRGTTSTVIAAVVPGVAGGGATLNYARLTSDLVGVYEVSFVIPQTVNPGNNVGFSIGVIPVGSTAAQYSNLIFIPVQ